MESKYVSLTKSFIFKNKLSAKSLNHKGVKERSLEFIFQYTLQEFCPLSTTLCFLLFRKLFICFSRLPDTGFCSN